MRAFLWSAAVLAAGAGCHQNPEDDLMSAPPPPPAAMFAPITESMTLEDRLQQLQHELDMALIRGRLDEEAKVRLYRAEAITDRIIEAQPPYDWLAESYDLGARLRQLQSLADRVIAKIRRDEEEERILDDAIRLRRAVISLREALDMPGGEAPPPLEALLAGGGEDDHEGPGVRRPGPPGPEPADDTSPGQTAPGDGGAAADDDDDGPRLVGRPVDG